MTFCDLWAKNQSKNSRNFFVFKDIQLIPVTVSSKYITFKTRRVAGTSN
jgi:hypothetical protein